MQVRLMRRLREKHRITICQIAKLSAVCRQRLVQIELGENRPTEHMKSLVITAFEKIIEQRRRELAALENDFLRYRNNLLDHTEEEIT